MLSDGILITCLVNFLFIAILPRKFFKQGAVLSVHFWVTAAPLFASPACLALAYFRVFPPFVDPGDPWVHFISLFSAFFSSISILLMGMSIGAHRQRIHMFHDTQDVSTNHLVTYGPYRFIRHPIYSSYLFALFAALVFCPQYGTVVCFLYGLFVLNKTAADEERRLSASEQFGTEYTEYVKGSGRFLPPLSALTLSEPGDGQELRQ
jgi:protein-S-isoprenylcysteine O-methyltransferase Ste14